MKFRYEAYGIPIFSSIELPALSVLKKDSKTEPVEISIGKVPNSLTDNATKESQSLVVNEQEMLISIENVAQYYIANGKSIIIEPQSDNWAEICLYLYANCLSAILFQRNQFVFHVSGIRLPNQKVVLFAAPSRVGKSTMAIKLEELGYPIFTDDTAVLSVSENKVYAQASYPMRRVWQKTIDSQTLLTDAHKQTLYANTEIDKYSYNFHNQFISNLSEVAAIVFLSIEGDQISIEKTALSQVVGLLVANVYRGNWLVAMNKNIFLHTLVMEVVKTPSVYFYKAIRPENQDTFNEFAKALINQIIKPLNEK